jgi:heme A synthase
MSDVASSPRRIFAIAAWGTLLFNVGVILGGTIVRATGSGDGCGESWPKCGDQFIPPNPTVETLIEFSHRATSFLAGIGILALLIMAVRLFPKRHIVRRAAIGSSVFLIIEALLGAALVLYGWVDADVSLGRTIVVPLHLANTFLLLGFLTLTAWWGSGFPAPLRSLRTATGRWVLVGALLLIALGSTGALNALADTVFPADSVMSDLAEKFGPTAPGLSRLRVVHPISAVLGGFLLVWIATSRISSSCGRTRRWAGVVAALVLAQMVIGIANIFYLTPLSLQVVHLMVADFLWIAYVIFGASWLGEPVRGGKE